MKFLGTEIKNFEKFKQFCIYQLEIGRILSKLNSKTSQILILCDLHGFSVASMVIDFFSLTPSSFILFYFINFLFFSFLSILGLQNHCFFT
mgnify:CR=1 FL=1